MRIVKRNNCVKLHWLEHCPLFYGQIYLGSRFHPCSRFQPWIRFHSWSRFYLGIGSGSSSFVQIVIPIPDPEISGIITALHCTINTMVIHQIIHEVIGSVRLLVQFLLDKTVERLSGRHCAGFSSQGWAKLRVFPRHNCTEQHAT